MDGYKRVKVGGHAKNAHRAFVERLVGRKLDRDEVIHHIDCDKRNNDVSNLIIMSRSDHAKLHATGNVPKEETIEKLRMIGRSQLLGAKLNVDDILDIRERFAKGDSCKDIAKDYDVSPTAIRSIRAKTRWGWV